MEPIPEMNDAAAAPCIMYVTFFAALAAKHALVVLDLEGHRGIGCVEGTYVGAF